LSGGEEAGACAMAAPAAKARTGMMRKDRI
jgi:hypothetical protein